MNKIEEVARALKANIGRQFDASPLPGPPDGSGDWTAEGGIIDCEELAAAAISAMREPSEAMVFALHQAFDDQATPNEAMRLVIDAALSEPSKLDGGG